LGEAELVTTHVDGRRERVGNHRRDALVEVLWLVLADFIEAILRKQRSNLLEQVARPAEIDRFEDLVDQRAELPSKGQTRQMRLDPGARGLAAGRRHVRIAIALVVVFFVADGFRLAMADDAREARPSPELVEALLAAVFGRSEIERGM